MDLHPFEILRKPIITEKSTDLQDDGRYVFEVAKSATKHQIKWAVQEAFGVNRHEGEYDEQKGQDEAIRATPGTEEGDKEGDRNARAR